jgi:uncharacterized low-complexity protein
MSKPEGNAAAINKGVNDLIDAVAKLDTKVVELSKSVVQLQNDLNVMKDTSRTDVDLIQTQLDELKTSMTQVLSAQSGAKKSIKAAEDKAPKEPAAEGEAKETKSAAEKKKKETDNEFFLRRCGESPEFKAKYDSEELNKACTNNRVKCKALHTILNDSKYVTLKAEFEAEKKASA